jgi:hypothetical protein
MLSTDVRDNESKRFRDAGASGTKVAVVLEENNNITLIDTTISTVIYLGDAVRSSIGSDPSWRITKIDSTGSVISIKTTGYLFDQIWDNRASLIYE